MNKASLTQAQLEAIDSLQVKLDSLRHQLGVADRGAILYFSEVSYGDDEIIVVEADGFGGATVRRGVGIYPTDFLTRQEFEMATEFDAVKAADYYRQDVTGQRGLASRWYPTTLARRIRDIAHVADRLTFVQGDAFAALAKYRDNPDAVFFIDPPYTAGGKRAGSRLYAHSEIDHERLFAQCEHLAGDFLMTYDHAPEVVALAKRHGFATRAIAMKNTHHAEMSELLIGRNLDWVG